MGNKAKGQKQFLVFKLLHGIGHVATLQVYLIVLILKQKNKILRR